MPREVVDDRLIAAIHLRALTLAGLDHDPVEEHRAVQAGTIDALMAGDYDGDASLGELLRLGDTGIGTVQHLGGELIILDGVPWLIDADGAISELSLDVRTPFAVACLFRPETTLEITSTLDLASLLAQIDEAAPPGSPILALRVHGSFRDLALRSVRRQHPPYPPLSEVVKDQTTFDLESAVGTLVGFRFPDATSGLEVPGYHLHFIDDERRTGGHVMGLTLAEGTVEIDHCETLHVELPPGVSLGSPGTVDRSSIDAVEGRLGEPAD